MKKLMMFAAAMTIVGGAFASACNPDVTTAACDVPVWDLTMSGKTANDTVKGYKAVSAVKVKGAIIGIMQEAGATTTTTNNPGATNQVITVVTNNSCCLDSFNVYVYQKAAGTAAVLYKIEGNEIAKMTVFGKNFAKLDPSMAEKMAGKSVALESDVMWTLDGAANDIDISLQFVGFGKTTFKWSKETTGSAATACAPGTPSACPVVVPAWPSWTGWFTGTWDVEGCDYYSMICTEQIDDVAGGTWSAKYNKKMSAYDTVETAESALEAKFKATIE